METLQRLEIRRDWEIAAPEEVMLLFCRGEAGQCGWLFQWPRTHITVTWLGTGCFCSDSALWLGDTSLSLSRGKMM